ncbi:hypothetical protein L6452_10455 [Arctium lappa]|uniref:Uncharacterized protein n=1 Tax=Arctium lappa TaxID=4217 RepID=A0ACB9DMP1_ARCLA|nr:hypothetical protein L6452_10455 [Arctium lappa]
MARQLIFIQKTILPYPGITFFAVMVGVVSVFSIVVFLCGSHGQFKRSNTYKREKNTVHLGDKKSRGFKLGTSLSNKALLMTKMISWRKEDEGRCEDDDEEAVWKRTIIMGERCRPLEFSGKLSYDENGNSIAESPRKHVASTDNGVVDMPKS